VIILNRIKLHTILYAYTRLLDTNCETETHHYRCRICYTGHGIAGLFPLSRWGHLLIGAVFSHLLKNGYDSIFLELISLLNSYTMRYLISTIQRST